jgi:glycosyltransferase involved in cell wall biosynthesis
MKILHVITSIDPKTGGTAEAVIRSAQIMCQLGHEVEVASIDAPLDGDDVDRFAWKTHRLGPGSIGSFNFSKTYQEWLIDNVTRFDAVIVHGLWQHTGFAARSVCNKNKVPYFVFTHGMLDPWFNKTYPLKKLKKMLYWRWGEYRVLRDACSVLFTCEDERLLAKQSFKKYNVNEAVVGLGTIKPTQSREHLRSDLALNRPDWADRPYFLFLSRIQEKKGLDLLVEAYAMLKAEQPEIPDLVIAGPDSQPSYSRSIQKNYSQDGISWVGSLRGEIKWQALASAEAMTLISHQENFGIVVAESLAVGTPVLISSKVNIWREVNQQHAGFICDDSAHEAYDILKKWCALDADAKKAMQQNAQAVFEAHFDMRKSTQNLAQHIQQTIQSVAQIECE